jgi:hypothetical protein
VKGQLVAFIEAYAAARASQNQLLQQMAAGALQRLLEGVEVRPVEAQGPAQGEAAAVQPLSTSSTPTVG